VQYSLQGAARDGQSAILRFLLNISVFGGLALCVLLGVLLYWALEGTSFSIPDDKRVFFAIACNSARSAFLKLEQQQC